MSARAARELRSLGFEASALAGGFDAWRAAQPVESIAAREVARI
jgi:rhodanese-related sulfurtransferase